MPENTPTTQETIKNESLSGNLLTNEELAAITDKTLLDKLRRLIPENANVPTHTPSSFQEQFYFQTGGIVWVYMSGTWVKVGGGGSVAIGSGTAPASNGVVEYTCGFRPKLLMITAIFNNNGTVNASSTGEATEDDDGQCFMLYNSSGFSGFANDYSTTWLVNILNTGDTTSCCAKLEEFTDTGFKINWYNTLVRPTFLYKVIG